jgi:polysaccharide export outer membrane protein
MKSSSVQGLSRLAGLLAVLSLLGAGCASTSDPIFTADPTFDTPGRTATNTAAESGPRPVLQPGNKVIVIFSEIPEQPAPHEEQIKDDGTITLPYIGPIKAAGKLPGELQKEIHALYVPKIYKRLTVTVKVEEVSRIYSVLGEVRAPGPKAYTDQTTLTKAIGASGGLTDFARKKKITITRADGSKITVNYNEAVQDPRKDPPIFPGDSIFVPKSIW